MALIRLSDVWNSWFRPTPLLAPPAADPLVFQIKDLVDSLVLLLDLRSICQLRRVNRRLRAIISQHIIYRQAETNFSTPPSMHFTWRSCLTDLLQACSNLQDLTFKQNSTVRSTNQPGLHPQTIQAALQLLWPEDLVDGEVVQQIFIGACQTNCLELAQTFGTCLATMDYFRKINLLKTVCHRGHDSVAEWLITYDRQWDYEYALTGAFTRSSLSVVQKLYARWNQPIIPAHLRQICYSNRADLFEWLMVSNPKRWELVDEDMVTFIVGGANLKILQLVQAHFPSSDLRTLETLDSAVKKNQPETIHWVLSSKEVDPNQLDLTSINVMLLSRNTDGLEALIAHGLKLTTAASWHIWSNNRDLCQPFILKN